MGTPRFTLRGFRRPREAMAFALGELEREIMEMLWTNSSEMSVRDVHSRFNDRLAYTTLMTTLDRLHKKGLLARRPDGKAFLYQPRFSRSEFERQIATDVIGGLLDRDAEPVVACIVEAVTEHDVQLLDELDRLIQQKRRELTGKKK